MMYLYYTFITMDVKSTKTNTSIERLIERKMSAFDEKVSKTKGHAKKRLVFDREKG